MNMKHDITLFVIFYYKSEYSRDYIEILEWLQIHSRYFLVTY